MPLENGATFAGFTIVGLLGSGGMGEVYLAEHPRLPRRDALKVLPRSLTADIEFRQRFIREADLAATLFHPHIVGVHDRGEYDDQLWISMDYIDGTDAAQFVRDRYPAGMPADEALAIATALAGALDYAHQRGLIHRDVKPGNILLSQPDHDGQRRIFLADFGIARPLADPSGLTATNLTVGTVAYAAPEQLMGEDVDGRADQYALAASVFHLLTGAPPYQHSNPVAVISQHLNAPIPKLSDRRQDLAQLDEVFSTALSKSPTERFESCGQFAQAFREHVGAESLSEHPTEAGVTVASPLALKPKADRSATNRRHVRLRTALLGIVALVAVGSIGAAMIHFLDSGARTTSTSARPGPTSGPTLEGTYRFVYDLTKQTINGSPGPPPPQPDSDNIRWFAFRSVCKTTGCVATGTALDAKNPQVPSTPPGTRIAHFTDGQWQATPDRTQQDQPQCLGVDGKIVAGSDTEMVTWSMEPQLDGTLRGVTTVTVLTIECGYQGAVVQTPFVATRTGEVPAGVTVADPAAITASPSTTTPAPPAAGPVLDGTYRIDFDLASRTVNGAPVTGENSRRTEWWAFRSKCTSTRCIASGAGLAESNQQQATGVVVVLNFTDGRWQGAPYLQPPAPCRAGKTGADTSTVSLSLQPQSDGTLRGGETITVLTDECGFKGNVIKAPLSPHG